MRWRHGWVFVLWAFAPSLWAQTAIYRCTVNGVPMFADHPCGSDAKPVTLDSERISTFEPVPAAKVVVPKVRRARVQRDEPVSRDKEHCVKLRASLRTIDDKLRSGYTAKQGVRLEERKRNLREQARELRC